MTKQRIYRAITLLRLYLRHVKFRGSLSTIGVSEGHVFRRGKWDMGNIIKTVHGYDPRTYV